MTEHEDRILECVQCGAEFVFTTGEQLFFETRGFMQPKRCKPCRQAKAMRPDTGVPRGSR